MVFPDCRYYLPFEIFKNSYVSYLYYTYYLGFHSFKSCYLYYLYYVYILCIYILPKRHTFGAQICPAVGLIVTSHDNTSQHLRGGNDGSQLCFGFTCTRASRSTESLCEWRPVWVGWFFKRCEMKPDHLKVLGKGWSSELSTHGPTKSKAIKASLILGYPAPNFLSL